MKLWRLTRAPYVALDGKGAELNGARYAPAGQPVVSLASEAGLAVLVALRYHLPDLAAAPADLVLGWTEAEAVPERVPDPDEDTIRAFIGEWLESRRSLLAAIRSKVLPETNVIYLNPRHPDATQVPPLVTRPFSFAECLHRPPMLDSFLGHLES
ncbi:MULTISPECIES: RES family NAD+ phosphorylase [unclassified Novosphingobium]|uniref:RES family NAD+ phosphorylase n=1 Tax=unclassified Novosphingobium TaxID=2644732 RepID=UPI0025DD5DA1|nr:MULTISPECIES: RES family NAD+ phosphorylase [unclassified Novosphingobium]HQV03990.1 RES family NAD+ phosphorylase [Novosphingobium sp.]